MKYIFNIALFVLMSSTLYAQPNCEVLKDDSDCYKSCKYAMKAIMHKQGSYKSQVLFDKSIDLCPSFAYSYMEKGVPFLKRGQFIEWKKLIDKAVELSPSEYLGYRGWCSLQFLRDYHGAIKDIESLKGIVKGDIGYCQTGDYHLEIALALCYREIGELKKAKQLFLNYMKSHNNEPDLYNYYHLGKLEFDLGNFDASIIYFKKQIDDNKIADAYYYLALAHRELNFRSDYENYVLEAEEIYRQGFYLSDSYTEPIDKIYLQDILDEKSKGQNEKRFDLY